MQKSAWRLLHTHPPCLVRLMARRKLRGKTVRAVSIQEIALASGLPLPRVREISTSVSWAEITIAEAERYVGGCGFDPLSPADRNRKSAYERSCKKTKTQFRFLRNSPWWETEFLPLIQLLKTVRLPKQ